MGWRMRCWGFKLGVPLRRNVRSITTVRPADTKQSWVPFLPASSVPTTPQVTLIRPNYPSPHNLGKGKTSRGGEGLAVSSEVIGEPMK